MKEKTEHRVLFDNSGCLTKQAIALFIEGSLSETELKKLRKHASNCKLCSNALDGANEFNSGSNYSIAVEHMLQSGWRKSLNRRQKSKQLFYGLSAVAASIIILTGIFFILKIDKLVNENLDLKSVSENVRTGTEDKTLVHEKPKDEAGSFSKYEEFELIKEDVKTIEEPSEANMHSVLDSDNEILEQEIVIEEESFNEIFEEDINSEELMMIEFEEENRADELVQEELPSPMVVESESKGDVLTKTKKEKKGFVRKERLKRTSPGKVYLIAEIKPMFQGGGIDNFNRYLTDSLSVIIPDSVWTESIVLSFVVDTLGNVDKVKLVSGTSSNEWNIRIIEFVKSSPVWVPGYTNGKVTKSEQQIEVVLDSTKENLDTIQ